MVINLTDIIKFLINLYLNFNLKYYNLILNYHNLLNYFYLLLLEHKMFMVLITQIDLFISQNNYFKHFN